MAPGIMPLSCCRAMSKSDGAKKPASETMPDQRWKLQVFYLCFYGFMTQIRPGESFITPYLLEANFTKAEVSCRHLVPHVVVPLYGHGHHPGGAQSIIPCFWSAQGCHDLGMAVCGDLWWCFWAGEVLWCGALSPLAVRSPYPLSPRLNLPCHKTSCPGWQLILGAVCDPCPPEQPVG